MGVAGLILGDLVNLTYTRSSAELCYATTEPLTAQCNRVHFAIGNQAMQPMPVSFNPATGVETFSAVPTEYCAPLPAIWFPFAVTVTIGNPGGAASFTGAIVWVEMDDLLP